MDTAYVAVFIFWIRVDEKPYHQVHTDLDIKQKSTVQPVQVLISIRIINVYLVPGTRYIMSCCTGYVWSRCFGSTISAGIVVAQEKYQKRLHD